MKQPEIINRRTIMNSRIPGLLALALTLLLPQALHAVDSENCLMCHRFRGLARVDKDGDYRSLLERVGWRVVEYRDLTPEFLAATQRQLATRDGREDKWISRIAALKDGLLRRELFVAAPVRQGA